MALAKSSIDVLAVIAEADKPVSAYKIQLQTRSTSTPNTLKLLEEHGYISYTTVGGWILTEKGEEQVKYHA